MNTRWIIGIDEAGRAPLAGPVAVGIASVPSDFDFSLLAGVRDSKKLTALARERWYEKMLGLEKERGLRHVVSFSSATIVDERGIVKAVSLAIGRCLEKLEVNPEECDVRLDGAIYAPKKFCCQKTIIGGGDIEPIISIAAIVAKVERDRLMQKLAKKYPAYGFDRHKGYGTRAHYEAIKNWGTIPLVHRVTYCP